MKATLKVFTDYFTVAKVTGTTKISKHQASKKGYSHKHNPSYGERKSAALNK